MKKILVILFVVWIAIAVFNTFYNVGKIFSEYRTWGPLTESQKRHMLFGELYDFIVFLKQDTTEKDHVLIYAKDARLVHLGIYFMYPEIVVSTRTQNEFKQELSSNTYDYVALYDTNTPLTGYKKVAIFKSKTSSDYGVLYKKK